MGDLQNLAPLRIGRRRRLKLTKLMLGIGLVLLLTVFFMGGWLLLTSPKVVAAVWGTVEKGRWTEVLYLRKERLLTAPADGNLLLQVKNGTLVGQGEILALLDRRAGGDQAATVSNSDRQRYNRYRMLVRQETVLNLDLRRIDLDLQKHLKKAAGQKNEADIQALQQEKEEVIRNIQVIRAQSTDLKRELAPLLQRWQFIIAAKPGSFVTEYDGWENTLTPEYLKKLTLNDFTRNYPLKSCGRQVRAGEIFGRLIAPFNQILAVKFTANPTDIPTIGTVWRVKTADGWKSTSLIYVKMFTPQTGVAGLTLQTEATDLNKSRLRKMFVVYQKITGVTIPVQALFKEEGHTVVRLTKGSGYREQTVQVLGDDGSKAVVSGIEVGAMIITR